ncbi:MAG: hypothetical protein ACE3L7_09715, partial [Candidatus Pristimantibacillus sp.]
LALRRYGAAYAAQSSGAEGTRPLAAHGNTQERFAAVSAATWQLLNRRLSVRPLHQTAREYGDAMSASMLPARAEALRQFIAWDDAAKFGQQGDWIAPQPNELAAAVQSLSGTKSK